MDAHEYERMVAVTRRASERSSGPEAAPAPRTDTMPAAVLNLQRMAGNESVSALLKRLGSRLPLAGLVAQLLVLRLERGLLLLQGEELLVLLVQLFLEPDDLLLLAVARFLHALQLGGRRARLGGFDLSGPVDVRTRKRLNQAFVDYSVIAIRDQKLNAPQFLEAIKIFGEIFLQRGFK